MLHFLVHIEPFPPEGKQATRTAVRRLPGVNLGDHPDGDAGLEVANGRDGSSRGFPDPRALDVSALLHHVAGGARGRSLPSPSELAGLTRATPVELSVVYGMGRAQAIRLSCAFELARRARAAVPLAAPCHSAAAVHEIVADELAGLQRERFLALLLDGKHRLKRVERVSEGTLTTSLVHPREVFRAAIREAAAAVVAVHNHPSGDPEPSGEDLEVTRRLERAGRLLGIPLLDHVVVGGARFVSLRERLGEGDPARPGWPGGLGGPREGHL